MNVTKGTYQKPEMKRAWTVSLLVLIIPTLLYSQTVTYYTEIQSIFNKNCISCHNSNGIAPFALENLEQIIAHNAIVSSVVERGIMPPWKPDPHYTHFLDERILSPSDKRKIVDWITNGCQKGSAEKGISVQQNKPEQRKSSADLIFTLPFAVKIRASTVDTTVLVEMPYELDHDTVVSSYEFVPAKNAGIHHVFITIEKADKTGGTRSDYEDVPGLDFWDGKVFHERLSYLYASFAGNWRPGISVTSMPAHIGWRIPKKGLLLYQLHYGPSPIDFTSKFELRFNYAKDSIERNPDGRKFGSEGNFAPPYPPLVIPADSIMRFTLNGPIDTDYSIISISPHMHLLGKSVKAWILKTNGDTIRLINIKEWDFNQQEFYYPPTLLKAEKGDMLQAEVVLDNTSRNPRNPNKPPRLVKYGPRTRDEMIQISLSIVPYRIGDEKISAKNGN